MIATGTAVPRGGRPFTVDRDRTNGSLIPAGNGLIGALTYFGLDSIGVTEKQEMRALVSARQPLVC